MSPRNDNNNRKTYYLSLSRNNKSFIFHLFLSFSIYFSLHCEIYIATEWWQQRTTVCDKRLCSVRSLIDISLCGIFFFVYWDQVAVLWSKWNVWSKKLKHSTLILIQAFVTLLHPLAIISLIKSPEHFMDDVISA